ASGLRAREELGAVDTRHMQIQEDHVRIPVFVDALEGAFAIVRLLDEEAGVRQGGRQRFTGIGVIVNHQHLALVHAHSIPPARCERVGRSLPFPHHVRYLAAVRGAFRRDLALAPGPGFHLARRRSARVFSLLLAVAAIGWGIYDLVAGFRVIGVATAALAVAFVIQIVQAELSTWRFEGTELRSRRLRLRARDIDGVHVAFAGPRAR